MKLASVHYHCDNTTTENIMIENTDDLIEYQEYLNKKLEDSMVRIFKSNVRPDRWNHLCRKKNHGDSIMAHSIIKSETFSGDNPLLKAPELAQYKIESMTKWLLRGETVLINKNGGWCTPCSIIEIVDVEEYTYSEYDGEDKESYYHIGNPTKAINLENDPDLEQRTKDYFEEINDTDPSYITNLREFSKKELIDIFNQFYENEGGHVFVYTTGVDVDQMYEYSDAIIESRIEKVVFEFNAGYNDNHKDVVRYLEDNNITVTVSEL
ncbi:hypothetical protein PBI_SCTP2_328 [Salicola phage SCTP-2]|nr:hypothetical protein PBI_SCTP2_328 [Salicola phage SCTP-2]